MKTPLERFVDQVNYVFYSGNYAISADSPLAHVIGGDALAPDQFIEMVAEALDLPIAAVEQDLIHPEEDTVRTMFDRLVADGQVSFR